MHHFLQAAMKKTPIANQHEGSWKPSPDSTPVTCIHRNRRALGSCGVHREHLCPSRLRSHPLTLNVCFAKVVFVMAVKGGCRNDSIFNRPRLRPFRSILLDDATETVIARYLRGWSSDSVCWGVCTSRGGNIVPFFCSIHSIKTRLVTLGTGGCW